MYSKKWIKLLLHFALVISLSALLYSCGNDDNDEEPQDNAPKNSAVSVKLIHTNDHHSYLDSSAYDLTIDGVVTRVQMGGFARLAEVIQEERTSNSIVVNSGELNGTLYFSMFKGEPDFKVFNELALDGYTLGNHEFDEGDEGLAKLIEIANFPILSSNITPKPESPLYRVKDKIKPYVIKEIDGQKIALLGILKVEKTKNSSMVSDNVEFTDEIDTAKKYVAELTAQGINKIILVSHLGYYNDLLLAKNVSGIDVIVGGDTHDLLGNPSQLAEVGLKQTYDNQTGPFEGYTHDGIKEEDLGSYPTTVSAPDGNPVHVVTAWCYARAVGILNVDFSADGIAQMAKGKLVIPVGGPYQQKDGSGTFVDVSETVKTALITAINKTSLLRTKEVNTTIENILKPYRDQITAAMSQVVGTVTTTLGYDRIPSAFTAGSTPTGSYAAQIVTDAFKQTNPAIDIAIQNAGGVRTTINQGTITMGDIIAVLPFSNTVAMINMKGSDIVQVLNEAAYYSLHSGSSGAFPYASGLRYDVNLSGAEGSVITNVEVQDRTAGTWSTIAANTVYTVATNSFTAQGKDNYLSFKRVRDADPSVYEDTSILYYIPLVQYFENLPGKILPALDTSTYCLKSVTN